MILRGLFWGGLIWLCVSHGSALPWRQAVLQHLGVVRTQLEVAIAQRQARDVE